MFKKLITAISLLLVLPFSTTNIYAATPLHIVANSVDYSTSQYVIKENHIYCSIETLSSMMGEHYNETSNDRFKGWRNAHPTT